MADEEEIQEAEEVSQEEETLKEGEKTVEETEEPTEEASESQESGDLVEGEKSEDEPVEEGAEEDSEAAKAVQQGFVARYWMLGLGLLMALIGIAGVISLRLNYAQVYILGDPDPYPGIGHAEPMGHMVSILPFVMGIIMVVYWGLRTPPLPEIADSEDEGSEAEVEETVAETEEAQPEAEPEEFGHEHLPAHHLSAIEKIEHLTKAYAQGKMSEGLYKENLARFEAELDALRETEDEAKPAKTQPATPSPAPARKVEPGPKQSAYEELKSLKPEVAKNEEDHIPPHHLSPEEKIDHLTKSYAQGKVSRAFFDKNLKKFEVELKREKEYLPPQELHPRQKLDQIEDAFKMGVISKSTYEKNKKIFQVDLATSTDDEPELDADFKTEVPKTDNLDDDLDSLLKEVKDEGDQKKPEAKKKSLMEELEGLEDL